LDIVLDSHTIKSRENSFEALMRLSGYYRDPTRWKGPWQRRGRITMRRFKDRSKPVLQAIAEVKASDGAAVLFPGVEPRKLGIDLERQCIDDVVAAVILGEGLSGEDAEIEVEGLRRDILDLTADLLSHVLTPEESAKTATRITAVMAACYTYNE